MKRRGTVVVISLLGALLIVLLAVFLGSRVGSGTRSASSVGSSKKAEPLSHRFPRDFPLYPGAEYEGSDPAQGEAEGRSYDRGWFHSRDDGRKVISWYDTHLAGAGFTPTNATDTGGGKKYIFAS